jgi:hypothetical protein
LNGETKEERTTIITEVNYIFIYEYWNRQTKKGEIEKWAESSKNYTFASSQNEIIINNKQKSILRNPNVKVQVVAHNH